MEGRAAGASHHRPECESCRAHLQRVHGAVQLLPHGPQRATQALHHHAAPRAAAAALLALLPALLALIALALALQVLRLQGSQQVPAEAAHGAAGRARLAVLARLGHDGRAALLGQGVAAQALGHAARHHGLGAGRGKGGGVMEGEGWWQPVKEAAPLTQQPVRQAGQRPALSPT